MGTGRNRSAKGKRRRFVSAAALESSDAFVIPNETDDSVLLARKIARAADSECWPPFRWPDEPNVKEKFKRKKFEKIHNQWHSNRKGILTR